MKGYNQNKTWFRHIFHLTVKLAAFYRVSHADFSNFGASQSCTFGVVGAKYDDENPEKWRRSCADWTDRFKNPLLFRLPDKSVLTIEQSAYTSSNSEKLKAIDPGDTSVTVWDAGIALSHILCDCPDIVRRKCVLELGAGAGLVGCVAACVGARQVILTDLGPAIPRCLTALLATNCLVLLLHKTGAPPPRARAHCAHLHRHVRGQAEEGAAAQLLRKGCPGRRTGVGRWRGGAAARVGAWCSTRRGAVCRPCVPYRARRTAGRDSAGAGGAGHARARVPGPPFRRGLGSFPRRCQVPRRPCANIGGPLLACLRGASRPRACRLSRVLRRVACARRPIRPAWTIEPAAEMLPLALRSPDLAVVTLRRRAARAIADGAQRRDPSPGRTDAAAAGAAP